jgi:hypothetical protein
VHAVWSFENYVAGMDNCICNHASIPIARDIINFRIIYEILTSGFTDG